MSNLILRLSELVDSIVEDYDVQIKYNHTGHPRESSTYINVVTSHKKTTLHIRAPDTEIGLIEFLVRHELAHLEHTDNIIAAYREIVDKEKLTEADVRTGQYLEREVVHFAINLISDHVINLDMDTSPYIPLDLAIIDQILPNDSREIYTIVSLILLSRHPHGFKEILELSGHKGLREFVRGSLYREVEQYVLTGSRMLRDENFKGLVEVVTALAGQLNRIYRSDDRPWRLMEKTTDVVHEGTPQSIKSEKLTEFREDTVVERIHSETVGSGDRDALALGDKELLDVARSLNLPQIIERGMGLERPRQINRYRGISTSLADKKRLVFFDSSNKWLERVREEKEDTWIIVDVSSSMIDTITSAKTMTNTIYHFFKKKSRIIAFNTDSYEIDRDTLRQVEARGGTNISTVAKHLTGYRGEPIAIISDFKFVPSHFNAFMSSLRRHRPKMVMLLPVDKESATRAETAITPWSNQVRFTIL